MSGVDAIVQTDALRALRQGQARALGRYQVVRSSHAGRPVFFAVRDRHDVIQRHHLRGRFYELPELRLIASAFRRGGTFFDFGANVGNHTLYAALVLEAGRVVPVEPNPEAVATLVANVALNRIEDRVEGQWLGFATGRETRGGYALAAPEGNLGAGRLTSGAGEILAVRGDAIVDEDRADFVKIDVEGMEIEVLAGLAATIARDRPPVFVEVAAQNRAAFDRWCDAAGYRVAGTHKRYKGSENFLALPAERPRDGEKDA